LPSWEQFQSYSSHYVPVSGLPELDGRIRWGALTLDEITSQKKNGRKLLEESGGVIRAYKRISPADRLDNITNDPISTIDEAVMRKRTSSDVETTRDPWDEHDDFSITLSFYVAPSRSQTRDPDDNDKGAPVVIDRSHIKPTNQTMAQPLSVPDVAPEGSVFRLRKIEYPKCASQVTAAYMKHMDPLPSVVRRVNAANKCDSTTNESRKTPDQVETPGSNRRRELARSIAFYREMDPGYNMIVQDGTYRKFIPKQERQMEETEKGLSDRAAMGMDRKQLVEQQHQARERQGREIQRLEREEPIEAKS